MQPIPLAGPRVAKICQVSWFGSLTHVMQGLLKTQCYTPNLCSNSSQKTKKHDANFVDDIQAGTWMEISLIWFGKESDERQSGEQYREGQRVSEERDWSLSGWKCQCAPGYAFSTCGSCHLCSFSHFCLMLSQTSPHNHLQSPPFSLWLYVSVPPPPIQYTQGR